ncbi:5'-AMP-activated protein kinase subunit beta-1-like [Lingula anatina]|uniref:5'-AMP-activated protein kinase subunit beta-1 n=1 Tax=Lingula anatina TaxID=7574 RepID=A0A1S3HQ30_LINAN|nr:5'-AMP-activated protein kinase subunit beta-1-like [Lingula anatina]|eukprot:XP_013387646.1 5'-AMP-activated protein kinase subunit beta-1-like [Lingula anatina]
MFSIFQDSVEDGAKEENTQEEPPTEEEVKNSPDEPETQTEQSKEEEHSSKLPVHFKWEHEGTEVYLIGSFSDWKDQVKMEKVDGVFCTTLELAEGEYQYKFVVDGEKKENHSQTTTACEDGHNNLIVVKKEE